MPDPLALALAQGRDPYAPTVPMGPGGVPRQNRYAPSDDASGADLRQRVTDWLPTTWPARMASAAWGGLTLPGDVAAGRVNPMSNEGIGRATELAGLLTLGGAASAPARETGLGIFGGRLARTADHQALAQAERMAAEGAPREAIWKDTGWFQGADGKWRFEIDDSGSRIGDRAMEELTAGGDHGATQRLVAGALWHKPLYEAYPDLRRTDVDIRYNAALSTPSGQYTPSHQWTGRPQIEISTNALAGDFGPRSVMLHELQHAIQDTEGLGIGGAPGIGERAPFIYSGPDVERVQSEIRSLEREAQRLYQSGAAYDAPELSNIRRRTAELEARLDPLAAREGYRRLVGETEARNVEARRNMTAEERAATPPWLTQDVPAEQQIVRFGQAGPAASDELVRALMSPTSVARWGR